MLRRRYFLSVIIITACINYNIVAMDLFSSRNSSMAQILRTASHVTAFGNMIYQNRLPIGITAAVTVLATSYDKPIVMYSTLGACNAYLWYKCMRLQKNMDQLITVHEEHADSVKSDIDKIKEEAASIKNEAKKLTENFDKIIPELDKRIDPLAEQVLTLKDLIEKTGSNIENQEASITALTKKLGVMKSGIDDLTAKQNALNDLVVTQAQETREHNTQNANRILALIPQTPKQNSHQSSMTSPRLNGLSGYWTNQFKRTSLNGSNQSSAAQ